jgi:sarcosine oxidase subunit gamma
LDGVRLPDGVRELPFLTQLDVWADPSAAGWLPTEPNTVHVHGDRAVLWLGPDEWLVVAPPDSAGALESEVRASLGDGLDAVVDVSSNRTTLELTGSRARDLLESGCSIDLAPRSFGSGRCAQTLLARAQIILWQLDEAPTYRVLVRPSFARYVATWLADAVEGQDA